MIMINELTHPPVAVKFPHIARGQASYVLCSDSRHIHDEDEAINVKVFIAKCGIKADHPRMHLLLGRYHLAVFLRRS